jgi:hypothetical protein
VPVCRETAVADKIKNCPQAARKPQPPRSHELPLTRYVPRQPQGEAKAAARATWWIVRGTLVLLTIHHPWPGRTQPPPELAHPAIASDNVNKPLNGKRLAARCG